MEEIWQRIGVILEKVQQIGRLCKLDAQQEPVSCGDEEWLVWATRIMAVVECCDEAFFAIFSIVEELGEERVESYKPSLSDLATSVIKARIAITPKLWQVYFSLPEEGER